MEEGAIPSVYLTYSWARRSCGIIEVMVSEILAQLLLEQATLRVPTNYKKWDEPVAATSPVASSASGAKSSSAGSDRSVMKTGTGQKSFKYKIEVWGTVLADASDFRRKVAETLSDARGWVRAGLSFSETTGDDYDLIIALSDAATLDTIAGCSGDLSCTTWHNQVIINDIRWRTGTSASNAGGMSTRDYQHMVLNHEVGHWLGHYSHIESCPNGGPAPIMLQQTTGLRGCSSFNAWPLDSELWTNK